MNGTIDRRLLAEAIIMLAVCIGGWLLIVGPKLDELQALEATIAEAKTNPMLRNHKAIEMMAGRLEQIRHRVTEIDAQNRIGGDSSRMYSLIMDLAREHSVIMQRLDPGSDRRDDDSPVKLATFNMRVEGAYDEVASFLEAVEGIDGFVRPTSLILTPRGEEQGGTVEAQFSCQAVSFTMPEALVSMVERDNADG